MPELLLSFDIATLHNGCSNWSHSVEWEFDWTDVRGANAYQLFVESRPASSASLIHDPAVSEPRL